MYLSLLRYVWQAAGPPAVGHMTGTDLLLTFSATPLGEPTTPAADLFPLLYTGDLIRVSAENRNVHVDVYLDDPATLTAGLWTVPLNPAAPALPAAFLDGEPVDVGMLTVKAPPALTATSAASLAQARDLWADAQQLPDATLTVLLDAAWSVCADYVPPEQHPETLPPVSPLLADRWAQANVLHARDLWTAYRRDGDVLGFDTYAVRVRPLSDTVKGLLRPQRGRPLVG